MQPPRGVHRLSGMQRPIGIVIAFVLLVSACGADPGPFLGPLTAEDVDGPFTLTLELPKATWRASESIEGTMTLRYDGPGVLPLRGSVGGILLTSFARADGSLVIGPAADAACGSHDIGPDRPIVSGLEKSGGFSADDPNAAFLNHFFAAPGIELPAGTWTITAYASFSEIECGNRPHDLEAAVTIDVVP